jgi:hypothetical protein
MLKQFYWLYHNLFPVTQAAARKDLVDFCFHFKQRHWALAGSSSFFTSKSNTRVTVYTSRKTSTYGFLPYFFSFSHGEDKLGLSCQEILFLIIIINKY